MKHLLKTWRVRCSGGALAFTLIELLIVVAILALLIALLLPALQRAQELAARSKCLSVQRTLASAVQQYSGAWGGRMPVPGRTYWGRGHNPSGNDILSWHWPLAQYIGQQYWHPTRDGGHPYEKKYTNTEKQIEIDNWESIGAIFYKKFGCPSWQGTKGDSNWGADYYWNQSQGLNTALLGEDKLIGDYRSPSEWALVMDNWVGYIDYGDPPSIIREMAWGWYDDNGGGSTVLPRHQQEGLNFVMLDTHGKWYDFDLQESPRFGQDIVGEFIGAPIKFR